jgi:hypothetical protein
MNILAVRAAAFVVGTMITGCVYTSSNASSHGSPGGIAIYPGAHRTSGNVDGDSAAADVKMPMVSLHIEAARYDSSDAPGKVIAFYQKELAKIGSVTIKGGGPRTEIRGFRWVPSDDQTTLKAGRTIVAVKAHGGGTEFGVIKIDVATPDGSHDKNR